MAEPGSSQSPRNPRRPSERNARLGRSSARHRGLPAVSADGPKRGFPKLILIGAAALVRLSELDLLGLASEVATSQDWRAVWERLSRALGEGTRTETYEGYDIASRKATRGEVFFALVREVLVSSTDLAAIKDVIDVH